jgi:hypothetical protein
MIKVFAPSVEMEAAALGGACGCGCGCGDDGGHAGLRDLVSDGVRVPIVA